MAWVVGSQASPNQLARRALNPMLSAYLQRKASLQIHHLEVAHILLPESRPTCFPSPGQELLQDG